jgi:hypothetical protein
MNMEFWLRGLAVLVAVAVADVAWARYNLSISGRAAHRAAVWSVVIVLLGAVSFVGYLEDRRMIAFAAVGAYLGTWVAVRRGKG